MNNSELNPNENRSSVMPFGLARQGVEKVLLGSKYAVWDLPLELTGKLMRLQPSPRLAQFPVEAVRVVRDRLRAFVGYRETQSPGDSDSDTDTE